MQKYSKDRIGEVPPSINRSPVIPSSVVAWSSISALRGEEMGPSTSTSSANKRESFGTISQAKVPRAKDRDSCAVQSLQGKLAQSQVMGRAACR